MFFYSMQSNRVFQPQCLGGLLSYFSPGQTTITKNYAYLYAMGIILCALIPVMIFQPFILFIFQIGMKIRIACCSLLYRKVCISIAMNGAQCSADGLGTYLWKFRDKKGVRQHTTGCESFINSCGSIHVYVLFHDFLVMNDSEFVIFLFSLQVIQIFSLYLWLREYESSNICFSLKIWKMEWK